MRQYFITFLVWLLALPKLYILDVKFIVYTNQHKEKIFQLEIFIYVVSARRQSGVILASGERIRYVSYEKKFGRHVERRCPLLFTHTRRCCSITSAKPYVHIEERIL